jgi:ribosome biogenesis GTPase / thiamine phosphate phosphatase
MYPLVVCPEDNPLPNELPFPYRVVADQRGAWVLESELRTKHVAACRTVDRPVTGDWVQLDQSGQRIAAIRPRHGRIVRKEAGARAVEQVLAANVDVAFIVTGLDGDFNLRRLERYLAMAWESGARPCVLLNKADLCEDGERRLASAREAAPGVEVAMLSALHDDAGAILGRLVSSGETAVLLGSSGVGKTSIVNRLLGGGALATAPVRAKDSRGRHTTVHRQLYRMEAGWWLMDLPGLREIQLWIEGDGLDQAFADIQSLAAGCRFRDCRHRGEPGCAVAEAVPPDRLDSYHRLGNEVRTLDKKRLSKLQKQYRDTWKRW